MKLLSKSLITYCATLMAIVSPFVQSGEQSNTQKSRFVEHWGMLSIHAKASKSHTAPVEIPNYIGEGEAKVRFAPHAYNFYSIEGVNDSELIELCSGGYIADIGFAQDSESAHSQIHCFVDNNPSPLTISFRLPKKLHFDERVILTQDSFLTEYRRHRKTVVIEATKASERVVAISYPSDSNEIRVEQSMTKNDFVSHLNHTVAALTKSLEQSIDEKKETRNFHVSNLKTWVI